MFCALDNVLILSCLRRSKHGYCSDTFTDVAIQLALVSDFQRIVFMHPRNIRDLSNIPWVHGGPLKGAWEPPQAHTRAPRISYGRFVYLLEELWEAHVHGAVTCASLRCPKHKWTIHGGGRCDLKMTLRDLCVYFRWLQIAFTAPGRTHCPLGLHINSLIILNTVIISSIFVIYSGWL